MDTTDLLRRVAEIEKLAKKATPGPWHVRILDRRDNGEVDANVETEEVHICTVFDGNYYEDRDFIAACDPPTMLAICATVRELVEENERLTNEVRS